jgi:hypothetical protein
MLSDKKVVVSKPDDLIENDLFLNRLRDIPHLKQFSARELCTTLHFLHSFAIGKNLDIFE